MGRSPRGNVEPAELIGDVIQGIVHIEAWVFRSFLGKQRVVAQFSGVHLAELRSWMTLKLPRGVERGRDQQLGGQNKLLHSTQRSRLNVRR